MEIHTGGAELPVDGIVRKQGFEVFGPAQPNRMRLNLVDHQQRHRCRGFSDGNIIQQAAVGCVGRRRGEQEADPNPAFACIRSQTEVFLRPAIGGRNCGQTQQRIPLRSVSDGNLDGQNIAGQKVELMPEGHHWIGYGGKVERSHQRQRGILRIGIVEPGRIAPAGVGRLTRLFDKRPIASGGPVGRPGFAVVEEREIHSGRQGHTAFITDRVESVRIDGNNPVIKGVFRGNRHIIERQR